MKTTIIGIAGGTASGKTTIAKKLYEEACKAGSVVLIRIDDYYYGLINVPKSEDGRPNFDHPDAYDVDLIIQNLNDLINYKAKELFLSYDQIFPYVGTYKALVNAIEYLGYDDIYFREWYKILKNDGKKVIKENNEQGDFIVYEKLRYEKVFK